MNEPAPTAVRRPLRQPVLGILVLIVAVVLSLGFIALFSWPTFRDRVSYLLVCGVPTLFVVGAFWRTEHPRWIGRLGQPWRGLAFLVLMLVNAAVIATLLVVLFGGGMTPPVPNVAHIAIMAVPYTFLLAVIWRGWPFRGIRNPVLGGYLLMVAAYALSALTYGLLANYASFEGGPAYVPALDPHGPFDIWAVMTTVVTGMAAGLLLLHLDFWPLTERVTKNPPVVAVASTGLIAAVTLVVELVGVGLVRLPWPTMLTGVTVAFLFGSIVVLNILQGRLPGPTGQPARGAVSALIAAVVGVLLGRLYVLVLPAVSGEIPFGAPGFQGEVWLASALLGVTFPLLAVLSDGFAFWPFRREPVEGAAPVQAAADPGPVGGRAPEGLG
ncbi:hypothetical protein [Raineyella sp. LH-20]|uniref:hypothetical protein n=1 Tax=Raineyella sp. LH-20 TaxID=3081204 RepID=UPI002953DC4B|nr:hypothetical protein [Raineyella sp. LH-20]WOP19561.1 hypothetical protein R0146_04595 [Raineyella sp. LH-20]